MKIFKHIGNTGLQRIGIKMRGFTLISTLFVLVVLSLLGGYMSRMSVVQGHTSAMSVQSARAWYAAVSGMEWTVYQITSSSSCPPIPSNFTVDGFNISVVQCNTSNVAEGGGPGSNYVLYELEVRASSGSVGSVDYVLRKVRAMIKNP